VPALADIACVNVTQEIKRNEIVLGLPYQVRQKNQKRNSCTEPQPFAAQVAPRVSEHESCDQPSDKERHRVF
jgi:hypothetical protein